MNNLDFEQFRVQYETRHPSSIPKLEFELNEYPKWVRSAVLMTFICAAMVSGIHTVPTVWESITTNAIVTEEMRTIVSYASLFAIELAILLSAYLMAKGVKLAFVVMVIASSVAILANLYSVINALGQDDIGVLVVAVALGIGAPMIALFSGKMFVDIQRADRVQDARARKAYKESCIEWDKEIDRAFKSYQKELKKSSGDSLSSAVSSRLSIQTDRQTAGMGFARVSSAVEIALDYLNKNPNAVDLSVRELGAAVGVGKDSAAKARTVYLSNRQTGSTNE